LKTVRERERKTRRKQGKIVLGKKSPKGKRETIEKKSKKEESNGERSPGESLELREGKLHSVRKKTSG